MKERKPRAAESLKAQERRSRRLHAFLERWARRHMPERVTRFTAR